MAERLKQEKDVPVWLVGTGMVTFSAANAAIAGRHIDGLVLTSTITRAKNGWKIASSHPNGVASMALPRVTVPTLILSHKQDGCELTPAACVRAGSPETEIPVVPAFAGRRQTVVSV